MIELPDRETIVDVLERAWLDAAEKRTVDSPRGHCERLADALIAAGRVA